MAAGAAWSWGVESIKLQVLSSTEAEYAAGASVCRELLHARQLFAALRMDFPQPCTVFQDNIHERYRLGVCVEIRKHPMGPVPKWGLYFYWGRGITRVGFNRPLYPAHVDASDSEFQKLLLVSEHNTAPFHCHEPLLTNPN